VKLFTKKDQELLQKQFLLGSDFDNQDVITKIFNPYGRETWYLINQDPNNLDYIWCIARGSDVDVGSVSKFDIEQTKINVSFGNMSAELPLERDLHFTPRNAGKILTDLYAGKHV
jgi:hypothetical protein